VGNEVLLCQFPGRAHVFSGWLLKGPPEVPGRTLLRTDRRVTGVT
jgi:hypothetical protein